MIPNTFAFIVLSGWPVVVYVLFRMFPQSQALAWSVLGGYLLLPTQTAIEVPGLPGLDKDAVPVLAAWLMVVLGVGAAARARKIRAGRLPEQAMDGLVRQPGSRLITVLLAVLFLSPVFTFLTNTDQLSIGPAFLPGMTAKDAASVLFGMAITVLPFLLAKRFFASPESHVILLKILVVGLAVYSLPILFEVRMSPQLNVWIYGFFPHDFGQHVRAGGFRPVVFLHHGLWLAIIVAMAFLATVALWRQRLFEGVRAGHWFFLAIYLLAILVLCQSLGALAIAVLFLPFAFFLGIRSQLLVAGIVGATVLLYPMLRSADLIPVDDILALAASADGERASSLEFRFRNEDQLLARAALRPLFGWGTWGRGLIHDPETGEQTSVSDGAWIIVIGSFGWVGYLASFGLLILPTMLLFAKRQALQLTPATAGLALVISANLVDLLMNDTLTPVTWLIGGALAGRYSYVRVTHAAPRRSYVRVTRAAPRRTWGLVTDQTQAAAEGPVRNRFRRAGPSQTPVGKA